MKYIAAIRGSRPPGPSPRSATDCAVKVNTEHHFEITEQFVSCNIYLCLNTKTQKNSSYIFMINLWNLTWANSCPTVTIISFISAGSGRRGVQGVRTPPKAAIYFNIKLLIHIQGPIIKSGRTPLLQTPDPPLHNYTRRRQRRDLPLFIIGP